MGSAKKKVGRKKGKSKSLKKEEPTGIQISPNARVRYVEKGRDAPLVSRVNPTISLTPIRSSTRKKTPTVKAALKPATSSSTKPSTSTTRLVSSSLARPKKLVKTEKPTSVDAVDCDDGMDECDEALEEVEEPGGGIKDEQPMLQMFKGPFEVPASIRNPDKELHMNVKDTVDGQYPPLASFIRSYVSIPKEHLDSVCEHPCAIALKNSMMARHMKKNTMDKVNQMNTEIIGHDYHMKGAFEKAMKHIDVQNELIRKKTEECEALNHVLVSERARFGMQWAEQDKKRIVAQAEENAQTQKHFCDMKFEKVVKEEKAKMEKRMKEVDRDRVCLSKENVQLTKRLQNVTAKVLKLGGEASSYRRRVTELEPTVWILRNCVIKLVASLESNASTKSTMARDFDSLLELSNTTLKSGKYDFTPSGVDEERLEKMLNSIMTDKSTKYTNNKGKAFFTTIFAESKGRSLSGKCTETIAIDTKSPEPETEEEDNICEPYGVDVNDQPDSLVNFENRDVQKPSDLVVLESSNGDDLSPTPYLLITDTTVGNPESSAYEVAGVGESNNCDQELAFHPADENSIQFSYDALSGNQYLVVQEQEDQGDKMMGHFHSFKSEYETNANLLDKKNVEENRVDTVCSDNISLEEVFKSELAILFDEESKGAGDEGNSESQKLGVTSNNILEEDLSLSDEDEDEDIEMTSGPDDPLDDSFSTHHEEIDTICRHPLSMYEVETKALAEGVIPQRVYTYPELGVEIKIADKDILSDSDKIKPILKIDNQPQEDLTRNEGLDNSMGNVADASESTLQQCAETTNVPQDVIVETRNSSEEETLSDTSDFMKGSGQSTLSNSKALLCVDRVVVKPINSVKTTAKSFETTHGYSTRASPLKSTAGGRPAPSLPPIKTLSKGKASVKELLSANCTKIVPVSQGKMCQKMVYEKQRLDKKTCDDKTNDMSTNCVKSLKSKASTGELRNGQELTTRLHLSDSSDLDEDLSKNKITEQSQSLKTTSQPDVEAGLYSHVVKPRVSHVSQTSSKAKANIALGMKSKKSSSINLPLPRPIPCSDKPKKDDRKVRGREEERNLTVRESRARSPYCSDSDFSDAVRRKPLHEQLQDRGKAIDRNKGENIVPVTSPPQMPPGQGYGPPCFPPYPYFNQFNGYGYPPQSMYGMPENSQSTLPGKQAEGFKEAFPGGARGGNQMPMMPGNMWPFGYPPYGPFPPFMPGPRPFGNRPSSASSQGSTSASQQFGDGYQIPPNVMGMMPAGMMRPDMSYFQHPCFQLPSDHSAPRIDGAPVTSIHSNEGNSSERNEQKPCIPTRRRLQKPVSKLKKMRAKVEMGYRAPPIGGAAKRKFENKEYEEAKKRKTVSQHVDHEKGMKLSQPTDKDQPNLDQTSHEKQISKIRRMDLSLSSDSSDLDSDNDELNTPSMSPLSPPPSTPPSPKISLRSARSIKPAFVGRERNESANFSGKDWQDLQGQGGEMILKLSKDLLDQLLEADESVLEKDFTAVFKGLKTRVETVPDVGLAMQIHRTVFTAKEETGKSSPFSSVERKLMIILLKLPTEVPQFYGKLPQCILEYFKTQVLPIRSTTFRQDNLGLERLGRFYGDLCTNIRFEKGPQELIFDAMYWRPPHAFALAHGILRVNSFSYSYLKFHQYDIKDRAIIYTLMRPHRFNDSKMYHVVRKLLSDALKMDVPDITFEQFVSSILTEFRGYETAKRLDEGTQVLAMLLIHAGIEWTVKFLGVELTKLTVDWRKGTITDGVFAAVLLAIGNFCKDSVEPHNLTSLKRVFESLTKLESPSDVLASAIKECMKKINDKISVITANKKKKITKWEWVYAKTPQAQNERLRIKWPKNKKNKKKRSITKNSPAP